MLLALGQQTKRHTTNLQHFFKIGLLDNKIQLEGKKTSDFKNGSILRSKVSQLNLVREKQTKKSKGMPCAPKKAFE